MFSLMIVVCVISLRSHDSILNIGVCVCDFSQVCDSILNIGPCANASMGEPAFLSEEVCVYFLVLLSYSVFSFGASSKCQMKAQFKK